MTLIEHFQVVLIFLLVGLGMILVPMVALALLRPNKPSPAKLMPYECGLDPIGEAQVCFDMRFYTDALIFLVFEVETVFLFPWVRVFNEMGAIALVEGLIFIVILFLGLAYVWAKGDLDWVLHWSSPPYQPPALRPKINVPVLKDLEADDDAKDASEDGDGAPKDDDEAA